jgi:D-3-phosphoglycerate dehydrogenase
MKNLKAIVRYGVGYDNIDVEACSKFGVKVANVQGYASHSVSDHALALLFSCTRAMWDTKSQLIQNFTKPPVEDIFELHDKTLGIIGLGRIGSKMAEKVSALFKNIIACDPYKTPAYFNRFGVEKVSLEEVICNSHIISINCNLTRETYHILDAEQFSKMKNKPVIINTSRGETIDEKALLKALNTGLVHSAGIDVYENEPTTGKQIELIGHPRTICTGHYAWYSNQSSVELQRRAAKNLLHLLNNKKIADSLN